jgi:hypothetical protein
MINSFSIYTAIFTPSLFSTILTRNVVNIFDLGTIYER